MDAFEKARQKHAKNLERRMRAEAPEVPAPNVPEVPIEKPKKPDTSAVIEVKVILPDGEFSFALCKPGVYQNATRAQLTPANFKNRIREGLKPLLGGVNDIFGRS